MLGRTFGLVALIVSFAIAPPSYAEPKREFRIGTGGVGRTYYPIGQIVAGILNLSPDVRAQAVTSPGSIENVEAVSAGWMESAFVQSDIAYWAYTGRGIFEGKGKPHTRIRALASLYPESIHLIVRRTARIQTLADLKGKRVALGDEASGTLVDARIVLNAAGLNEKRDIQAHYLSPEDASAAIIVNDIDAYFAVAGFPAANVSRALNRGFNAHVLALTGPGILSVIDAHKFLSRGVIPAGVYQNRYPIPTINVSALMVVSEEADPEFVYHLAKALWRPDSLRKLATGHPKGELITIDTALDGIGTPLHKGAEIFYREAGLIKE